MASITGRQRRWSSKTEAQVDQDSIGGRKEFEGIGLIILQRPNRSPRKPTPSLSHVLTFAPPESGHAVWLNWSLDRELERR